MKQSAFVKRTISVVLSACLAVCLLASLAPVMATDDTARAVIGANLTNEQTESMYSLFGVTRGSVRELSMTNAEERSYLEGYVDSSLIGTNSISCVYLKQLDAGSGVQITVNNINWCTADMYSAALSTAGITDVQCVIAAPFEVSGTAALAGIYKAYEDITGETIDDIVKQVSTQELITTADLAEELGSYDASMIVSELKGILSETQNMTDDEIREEIRSIAGQYNVSVTDTQINQLLKLCREMEKLSDVDLMEKVQNLQSTVKKVQQAGDKVEQTVQTISTVAATIKTVFTKVTDFFAGIFKKA